MYLVDVQRHYAHPVGRVFKRYVDHEGWSDWAGVGPVRLLRPGSPERDGIGALRVFSLSPFLKEEVVRFEPPTGETSPAHMNYRALPSLAPMRDHFGQVSFTPDDGGTRVTWVVTFNTVPVLGWALERVLAQAFGSVLRRLGRDLDRSR